MASLFLDLAPSIMNTYFVCLIHSMSDASAGDAY